MGISLAIPKQDLFSRLMQKTLSLYSLLNTFCKQSGKFTCEKCNKTSENQKNFQFLSYPNMLCIQIERFQSGAYDNQMIDFPLDNLDLGQYVLKNDEYSQSTSGYHLTALIDYDQSNNRYRTVVHREALFYSLLDSCVHLMTREEVALLRPYLLIYQNTITDKSMAVRKNIQSHYTLEKKELLQVQEGFYLCNSWIEKFLTLRNYGTITNYTKLCVHGQLRPLMKDCQEGEQGHTISSLRLVSHLIPSEIYLYLKETRVIPQNSNDIPHDI